MPVFQSSLVESGGLALNSWQFLAVSLIAIVLSLLIADMRARNLALLSINIYVLAVPFAMSLASAAVLSLFLVTVYIIGLWRKGAKTFTINIQLAIVTGFWVFLFLVRDGDLFLPINPFHYMPVYIIGISYMVFRCISFIMEVEFIENPNFPRFCAYVIFFPGLIAGPIERYRVFEQQLSEPVYDTDIVLPALHRIATGFIKKFVIADNLSVFGVFSYADPAAVSTPMLWAGGLSQLGLIFLDFSGYCDIVIGVAALMGFRMQENFNKPFHSVSIQEFWNRWHISLSTLVRDYIFTPINIVIIKKVPRQNQFLLITAVYFLSMILIGLWHGTTWGFVAFGALHGAALVASQVFKSARSKKRKMKWYEIGIRRFLVYAFVSLSLILWLRSADEWGGIYAKLLGLEL